MTFHTYSNIYFGYIIKLVNITNLGLTFLRPVIYRLYIEYPFLMHSIDFDFCLPAQNHEMCIGFINCLVSELRDSA